MTNGTITRPVAKYLL